MKIIKSKPTLHKAFNSLTERFQMKVIESYHEEVALSVIVIVDLENPINTKILGLFNKIKENVVAIAEDHYFSISDGYFTPLKSLLKKAEKLSGVEITIVL